MGCKELTSTAGPALLTVAAGLTLGSWPLGLCCLLVTQVSALSAAGKGLRKPAHRNKLNSCGNNLYVAIWPALVLAADANAVLRFLANVCFKEKV